MATDDVDIKLTGLCREALDVNRLYLAAVAQQEAGEKDAYRHGDAFHSLMSEIAAIPARTTQGQRAKANVLEASLLQRSTPFVPQNVQEALMFSVVQDLCGRSAPVSTV